MTKEPEKTAYIRKIMLETGIETDEQTAEKLLLYYKLLSEKNKVMNLTAITGFEEAVEKHFADSLALLRFLDLNNMETLLDVGSGAGFPGIPLKIVCPGLSVSLLDAVNKKTEFQKEVGGALSLNRFIPIHMRSEDAAKDPAYREQFDIVTARAVANLATLAEYCLPFVKIGGIFAAYKTDLVDEELEEAKKAIRILGGTVEKVEKYRIAENGRSIVLIRKEKGTPSKYPRKAGTPSKQPIR